MAKVNKKIENIYSLTPLQEGMLFHNIYDSKSTAYIMQIVLDIRNNFRYEYFGQALALIAEKHQTLRSMFVYENVNSPKQVILKEREIESEFIDLTNNDEEKRIEEYNQILKDDKNRGFNLQKDSLIRIKTIKLGEKSFKVILTAHHIITDGWSNAVLIKELFDIYDKLVDGTDLQDIANIIREEKASSADYGDYILWHEKQDKQGALDYWDKVLEGYEGSCDIAPLAKGEQTDEQMLEKSIAIKSEITAKLRDIAKKNDVTINTVAETAVGMLLRSYTRNDDVVYGKVVSGRNAHINGIERMVGLFINTVPLRMKVEENETIDDLLVKIQKQGNESSLYDYCSLAEIQSKTIQGPDLIKVIFIFENYSSGMKSSDIAQETETVSLEYSREQTNYGISIICYDEGDLRFNIMFDPAKYSDKEIDLILERIEKICEEISEKHDLRINETETVTNEERKLILNDFNATETEYPRDKTVAELFEEQVKKTPDNTAVVFEDKSLTYSELNARANSLAHKLRELGVKPDDFVAIVADRSIEMICGIYGIIKSGGAYVPIDPTYPEDRISFMLEDCKPKAVLKYTTESINICSEIPVIDLADSKVWEGAPEDPEYVNKPSDLIYCIYTSGTTGKPKGVPNIHSGLINRIFWMNSRYPLGISDTILQKTTFTFDVSVWEIIWWSLVGARVALLAVGGEKDPGVICDTIEKCKVTTMHFVPSMLSIFEEYAENAADSGSKLKSLKNVFASGEALKKVHVEKFYDIAEKNGLEMKLANFYGPTEASIDVTYYDCVKEDKNSVPIGKPIFNTNIYIVNDNKLCGIGIPGELCIAGDGLARGYLNRPELTEEKFVKDPFGEGRMYRSGDLARWLPDGNIEYLGRIDEQVKIRGLRIELGEIESRIREIENIRDCAVIAREDITGDKAIYAYYTSDNEVSVSEIRDRLSESLPEYMIPSYMMQIEAIPVTRNGKLDKRALPEIGTRNVREYEAPRNEEEEAVCKAFSEILNVEKVGIKDGFFELGGDSIKAIRMISALRNAGYAVTVKDIMTGRTVEKIALSLVSGTGEKKYEQGEVTGRVEPTPIIKDFGEWKLSKPEHFNQAMMFTVDGTDNNIIHQAVEELAKHHDVLRAVYRNNGLEILPIRDSKLCDFYEFDYSSENDKHTAVADKCTEIQGSIDLINGPLVKIAVFELGDTKQMMFCIHHLAVDGVSWRILGEDFYTAVRQIKAGEKVSLPEKTASFIEWSRKLNEYGAKLTDKERDYWKKVEAEIAEGGIHGEYPEEKPGAAVMKLSKEITENLLTKSLNAYGAKIDEILIAGLARAVGRITGQKKLAIKLEGHGREEIHEPISTDRTVGWFTNVYAVCVECTEDDDAAVINAKDTIRGVPEKGMGYGFAVHEATPDICFNYLGDFSGSSTSYTGEYSTGDICSRENRTDDKITVNGQIREGELEFLIMSQYKEYGQGFIEKIKDEFTKAMIELSEFCATGGKDKRTRSDLRDKDLDNEELDILNTMFS